MGRPGIAVVGSINMDLSVRVSRLPRPGETVIGGEPMMTPGGKGANQAVAAARLGAAVTLLAVVGDDAFGARLCDEIAAEGVATAFIGRCDAATGSAMILVDDDGDNMITICPGANARLDPTRVDGAHPAIASADVLLLQLEIPVQTAVAAARIARSSGTKVVINAAPLGVVDDDLLELLAQADLVVVNETEAIELGADARVDASQQAISLRRRLHVDELVITLGARGAVAANAGGSHDVSGFSVSTVDAVGAGDAFCAEIALARTGSASLADATRRACAAGALATIRPGALLAMPTRNEVDGLLPQVS